MLRKLSPIGPILEVPNPNKPRRMWLPTWPYFGGKLLGQILWKKKANRMKTQLVGSA
jgi:hypothetical protein